MFVRAVFSVQFFRFELAQAVKGEVPLKELEIIIRAKHGIKLKISPRNCNNELHEIVTTQ